MNNIRNLTYDELKEYIISIGEKPFRANQIFDWIHKEMVSSYESMTNISNDLKDKLKENYSIYMPTIYNKYESKIDDTKKYLLLLEDQNIIECVLMKYKFGLTICISSQVGCNMSCKFCASSIGGSKRNLQIGELLSQIYVIQKDIKQKISNIVIMGSGEPLMNYENIVKFLYIINDERGQNISFRNITISTCGIVPKIKDLSKLELPITLALSLHSPNQEVRQKIMPIANKYDYDETLNAIKEYYLKNKRRITIEYSLMKNINDSEDQAHELSRHLRQYFFNKNINDKNVDFNVNLIPVNEVKEFNIKRPSDKTIYKFKNILENNNINVTIRRELGSDISSSCGMLRRRHIGTSF
ncbi:MAG: 23S rRNA (adenine(2503)-C(2))-methyltransferase RlmN [Eubacteriales bacterium]|nr:23S rRNA (adenine(2503)-C(2))-methyltransferase RlmN [Eubacteriales bacterium]